MLNLLNRQWENLDSFPADDKALAQFYNSTMFVAFHSGSLKVFLEEAGPDGPVWVQSRDIRVRQSFKVTQLAWLTDECISLYSEEAAALEFVELSPEVSKSLVCFSQVLQMPSRPRLQLQLSTSNLASQPWTSSGTRAGSLVAYCSRSGVVVQTWYNQDGNEAPAAFVELNASVSLFRMHSTLTLLLVCICFG